MAETIRFERMVHIAAYDELATRWFKPAHPRLHKIIKYIYI